MRRLILLACAALSGCGNEAEAPSVAAPPDEAKPAIAQLGPEQCRSFGPCYTFEEGSCRHIGVQACKWLPPSRVRGIWYAGIEDSHFEYRPASAHPRDELGEPLYVWLEVKDRIETLEGLGVEPKYGPSAEIEVELIGRRSRMSNPDEPVHQHILEVDRIVSARVLSK